MNPLLSIIYINDLDHISISVHVVSKFADDHKICGVVRNALSVYQNIWMNQVNGPRNGVVFDADKCEVMHLLKSKHGRSCTIKGRALENVVDAGFSTLFLISGVAARQSGGKKGIWQTCVN